ncbi:MAG: PAS domain-containing protein [Desulfobacteraceae bacterium]|nr:MAG: PAS domain-containing protein [Desulfobacteraceae bacterium]
MSTPKPKQDPPKSGIHEPALWHTFGAVLTAIPCGLAMVDRQGRISHWNPAAEKLTGLAHAQVIGQACSKVFNCPNFEASCPLTGAGNKPAGPLCMEIVLADQKRNIYLQKTAAFIRDDEGRPIGAIETLIDLTAEREAQTAQHEARDLLESARRAKRHFMANMSHEIRTPLNGILGMLSLLLNDAQITPQQRENLTIAQRSAELLVNLIGDILNFTIIDRGAVNIECTGFSLRSIIASVIGRQFDLTQNRAVSIHTHVQDDVPDNLLGDSGRLYQILKHLVGNAIKFTQAGEVAVHVVRAEPAESKTNTDPSALRLHFSISHTGIGIPKDKLDHLFESPGQVDDSPTRPFGGLGNGLNIVHRLVGLLEGRIWMESKPGAGTTVHFTLPFRDILNCEVVSDPSSAACMPGAGRLRP